MRIWSIHPQYLDAKGLVALWRETLLAKHVLEGRTKGYRNHPQLDRFKQADNPVHRINQYLSVVYYEALERNYNFDKGKIDWDYTPSGLIVTTGQIAYETVHLLKKLEIRDKEKFDVVVNVKTIEPHPMFNVIKGGIADWEIT